MDLDEGNRRKSEDNLGDVELALDKQTHVIESLTKRVKPLSHFGFWFG